MFLIKCQIKFFILLQLKITLNILLSLNKWMELEVITAPSSLFKAMTHMTPLKDHCFQEKTKIYPKSLMSSRKKIVNWKLSLRITMNTMFIVDIRICKKSHPLKTKPGFKWEENLPLRVVRIVGNVLFCWDPIIINSFRP